MDYNFDETKKRSPLNPLTIRRRFYGKNSKKWGVHYKLVQKKEKVVSEEDFNKYFTQKFRGIYERKPKAKK
jgi:hypothetical protein